MAVFDNTITLEGASTQTSTGTIAISETASIRSTAEASSTRTPTFERSLSYGGEIRVASLDSGIAREETLTFPLNLQDAQSTLLLGGESLTYGVDSSISQTSRGTFEVSCNLGALTAVDYSDATGEIVFTENDLDGSLSFVLGTPDFVLNSDISFPGQVGISATSTRILEESLQIRATPALQITTPNWRRQLPITNDGWIDEDSI